MFLVKLGSVTNAQRARSLLSKNGYSAYLSRLQNPKAGDGCGYVLKVGSKDRDGAVNILEKAGINILGVEDA